MVRSNSSARMRVSPTSMPTTYPWSGLMRSRTRGRPPSESTEPASITMPSWISSRITLLTEAELSPVASLRSCRLHG